MEPFPQETRTDARLVGHIETEVKTEYLPRALAPAPEGNAAAPTLRYHAQVSYEPIRVDAQLNPLPVLGFRKLGMDVIAQGILEIEWPGADPHTWIQQCTVYMRRSYWNDLP